MMLNHPKPKTKRSGEEERNLKVIEMIETRE